jgi:hypothetical protein
VAKPSTDRTWVAETLFSGVIAELRLPRPAVERLLPPELCLEPRVARARTAPILMAFGTHTASAVHLAALRVRTGVTFHEVFFGVRCQIRASRTPVLFVPLMYCDEPVSTRVGNALYGFNKKPAVMEWVGSNFVVMGDEGRVLLRATREAGDGLHGCAGRDSRVADLPIVGRRQDGTYVSSWFDWPWEAGGLAGVRVVVAAEEPLIAGAGRSAVQVRSVSWRISWPQPCRSVVPDVALCHGA